MQIRWLWTFCYTSFSVSICAERESTGSEEGIYSAIVDTTIFTKHLVFPVISFSSLWIMYRDFTLHYNWISLISNNVEHFFHLFLFLSIWLSSFLKYTCKYFIHCYSFVFFFFYWFIWILYILLIWTLCKF